MRIFLTVGSMLPFDRLVLAVDNWAQRNPETKIFAQIGSTKLQPKHVEARQMISPAQYRQQFELADLVISHVGMGTVITAAEYAKPLVLLARRAELAEVTNGHQQATARWLKERPGIFIADDIDAIDSAITKAARSLGVSKFEASARSQLIDSLKEFFSA